MADAFISYRRKPSAALAQLIQEKLKNQHGIDAYVDTTRTDSSRVQFPQRLMQAIADSPVFICLLGEDTLESEWVLKEINRAHEAGKYCIPVFQESYQPPEKTDSAVDYLLNFDGVHVFDVKSVFVNEAVAQIASLIPRQPVTMPPVRETRRFPLWLMGAAALLVIGIVVLAALNAIPPAPSNRETPTAVALAQETEVVAPTDEPTATQTVTPDLNATVAARQAIVTATFSAEQTAYAAATATASSPTPTPDDEATVNAALTATHEMVMDVERGRNFSGGNADWTPIERDFDGVTMVLVPVGCFEMGANSEGGQQCFEEPFWIGKYEVTNVEYERFVEAGGYNNEAYWTAEGWAWRQGNNITVPRDYPDFTAPDQPRVGISWYESVAYANWLGMRLPTTAEWEYAARGPDRLRYPWGNEFNGQYLNFCDVNCTEENRDPTFDDGYKDNAPVGSYPDGVSWVGALDVVGNVWEYTSSQSRGYPYNPLDGREDLNSVTDRVVRGGSRGNVPPDYTTALTGSWYGPTAQHQSVVGFRLARSVFPNVAS